VTAAAADLRFDNNQRWIVLGLTVVVAATRFLAVRMWAQDEALVVLLLHHCDVSANLPSAPGSPLYVALLRQHFGDDSRDHGMQLRTIWWKP
jgi:hypothetical protein